MNVSVRVSTRTRGIAMATVVDLHRETIAQFVKRRGEVFTNDVATRFGLYIDDARNELKALERAGVLTSKRERAGGLGNFAGAGLVWRVRD